MAPKIIGQSQLGPGAVDVQMDDGSVLPMRQAEAEAFLGIPANVGIGADSGPIPDYSLGSQQLGGYGASAPLADAAGVVDPWSARGLSDQVMGGMPSAAAPLGDMLSHANTGNPEFAPPQSIPDPIAAQADRARRERASYEQSQQQASDTRSGREAFANEVESGTQRGAQMLADELADVSQRRSQQAESNRSGGLVGHTGPSQGESRSGADGRAIVQYMRPTAPRGGSGAPRGPSQYEETTISNLGRAQQSLERDAHNLAVSGQMTDRAYENLERSRISIANESRRHREILDDELQKHERDHQVAMDSLRSARSQNVEDYWAKKGTGAKIAAAIAVGLGAYSQTMGGGPNTALQIINAAIDRDINEQMRQIEQGITSAQEGVSEARANRNRVLSQIDDLPARRALAEQYAVDTLQTDLARIGANLQNANQVENLNRMQAEVSQRQADVREQGRQLRARQAAAAASRRAAQSQGVFRVVNPNDPTDFRYFDNTPAGHDAMAEWKRKRNMLAGAGDQSGGPPVVPGLRNVRPDAASNLSESEQTRLRNNAAAWRRYSQAADKLIKLRRDHGREAFGRYRGEIDGLINDQIDAISALSNGGIINPSEIPRYRTQASDVTRLETDESVIDHVERVRGHFRDRVRADIGARGYELDDSGFRGQGEFERIGSAR